MTRPREYVAPVDLPGGPILLTLMVAFLVAVAAFCIGLLIAASRISWGQ